MAWAVTRRPSRTLSACLGLTSHTLQVPSYAFPAFLLGSHSLLLSFRGPEICPLTVYFRGSRPPEAGLVLGAALAFRGQQ